MAEEGERAGIDTDDKKAEPPVSSDLEQLILDEKASFKQESGKFGGHTQPSEAEDKAGQQSGTVDRSAAQDSLQAILNESSEAAVTAPGNHHAADEVDDEVRSLIDHFKGSAVEDEAENEDKQAQALAGQDAQGDNATETKGSQSTTQEKAGVLHLPDSPSATRATNLTAELHRKSLPPAPEPEAKFNFHLFLEQLKHRTADPVARYLRSFLIEFGKKQWTVNDQVRIISDFLSFITGKMSQCEIWADHTESEFDNAREGMEKLVMTRLYSQTFSPEMPAPPPSSDARGRKRTQKTPQTGRKGQHQEDVERDHVLAEKMQIFGWVEEQHLDIPTIPSDSRRFLSLAQQELSKINNYRAPRDKVICILNACKVIFGLLRNFKGSDTSADSFMPLLIYTVLRARPRHMVSNIQYIFRFRNQDKLGGESGYYLSSLMGAVQFIENLDRTALTISDEEFERHVEASVAAIAERQKPHEASKPSLQEPARNTDASTSRSPARLLSDDDTGTVQDIIRNIQRPLVNLGRMFSDEGQDPEAVSNGRTDLRTPDATPGRQTSARATEHPRQRTASDVDVGSIVETLSSMFPTLDRDVISDIVIAKQARIGAAVDACLSLTS